MGFDLSAIRAEFPVSERYIYLNHASVAPLCRRAAQAMQWLTDDALLHGAEHYDLWLKAYKGLRVATARLTGAQPEEIAIVKNTSEGVATVALGIDWRPGDKVVAFTEEFAANFFPWKRLEAKGVSVEWLSIYDGLDRIEAACRGARLLAVSFVNYLTGHRVDVERIGEICRQSRTFFFLDAIQGLGAFPLDVRRCGIHALAADGHKWLVGPEGCGILYVRRDWQDRIEPVEFGWTNVARYADYASRDMTLRPDAGRYECGTLNTVGCFGLQAAMEYLLEVGVENIGPVVQGLADRMASGLEAKGYELAAPRTHQNGAGIVSARKQGVDTRTAVHHLREKGAIAAPRQGWIRFSPHFYVSPDEIDQVISWLP